MKLDLLACVLPLALLVLIVYVGIRLGL